MCQNFTSILLPVFETQNMVKRAKRKIRSKTARQMITWSHYQFQQRLITKAEEWGVRVILCDESYTSRTCGACGLLRPKFSSKTFKCPHCHSVLDRDVNAARNILLRALVDPEPDFADVSCDTPRVASVSSVGQVVLDEPDNDARVVGLSSLSTPAELQRPETTSKEVVDGEKCHFCHF